MATEVARESKKRRSLKQDRAPAADLDIGAQAGAQASSHEHASGIERAKSAAAEHAVFLVPGLLGFESISTFSYFADRVVAALRASLEQTFEQSVPVIALPIPPTASLHERQCKLVKSMADRLHVLEHGARALHVHVVGHSTGGVDANLLLQEEPVGARDEAGTRRTWTDVDPRALDLRERIRSVISIASPQQGACITRDPLARFVGSHDLRALPAALRVTAEFFASAASDVEVTEFLESAAREFGKTRRFLSSIAKRWELVADLDPSRAAPQAKLDRDVLRRTFVTITGRAIPGQSTEPNADVLFRDFAERASGWRTGCAEEGLHVQASVERLNRALATAADALVIKAPGIALPAQIDAGCNDGVVNCARQLIDPSDEHELAGIVVADHFDVVGYYDRSMWIVDDEGHEQPKMAISGLLHSGSGFRDDQFFELYRRVASVIALAAR